MKPNPYLLDTIRHILAIALGTYVGFGTATYEHYAPIDFIQRAYVESYRLKYAPVMMHPMHFSLEQTPCQPVYYSLNFPSLLSFSLKWRKTNSTLEKMRELYHVFNVILDEMRKKDFPIENTVIDFTVRSVAFDLFHDNHDKGGEIKRTHRLPEGDHCLQACLARYPNLEFPEFSTFLKGCVRIAKYFEQKTLITNK